MLHILHININKYFTDATDTDDDIIMKKVKKHREKVLMLLYVEIYIISTSGLISAWHENEIT